MRSLVIVLVALLGLVGCGDSGSDSGPEDTAFSDGSLEDVGDVGGEPDAGIDTADGALPDADDDVGADADVGRDSAADVADADAAATNEDADDVDTRPDPADGASDAYIDVLPTDSGSDTDVPSPVAFNNWRVDDLGATRAVVRFDTSIPTSCELEYGLVADTMDQRATDPNMEEGELALDHEVPLEDLEPETTYLYRARVEDADGTISRSEIRELTTLAADPEPTFTNWSLDEGVTVTGVSSYFGNSTSFAPERALDGSMSTEWSSQGDGDDAWVEIDLGTPRRITHIGFRSRKMTDGSSIIESFAVTFDGGDPVGPFASPDPDERYVFELEPAVDARVVRVDAVDTSGGNTGAKEIELLELAE